MSSNRCDQPDQPSEDSVIVSQASDEIFHKQLRIKYCKFWDIIVVGIWNQFESRKSRYI